METRATDHYHVLRSELAVAAHEQECAASAYETARTKLLLGLREDARYAQSRARAHAAEARRILGLDVE